MEDPKDFAPVWLTGIATLALGATIVALMHGESRISAPAAIDSNPPASASPAPWPTAARFAPNREIAAQFACPLAESTCLPLVAAVDERELARDLQRLLITNQDAGHTLAGGRYVRRYPVGPLAAGPLGAVGVPRWSPKRDSTPLELFVLVPSEPLRRAGAPRLAALNGDLRLTKEEFTRLAFMLGRWWASTRAATLSLPHWLVSAPKGEASPPTVFSSPASLLDPVRVGAGDRLAMTPRRSSLLAPKYALPQRETPRVAIGACAAMDDRQPTELLQLLAVLAAEPATAAWATEAQAAVEAARSDLTGAANATLDKLSMQGLELADSLGDMRLAITLRRACYAINRRTLAWRIIGQLQAREATVLSRAPDADERLRKRLAAVLSATRDDQPPVANHRREAGQEETGDAWRRYLLTDRLDDALREDGQPASRDQLAADILRRMAPSILSAEQRRFVATGPIAALGDELHAWGGPPTDTLLLASNLEAYETSRSPHLAQVIARDVRQLNDSSTALHRELAGEIEKKYRNANLRVAVAAPLLSRFVPAPSVRVEPVRQRIAGTLVQGQSQTNTRLSLRLLPDPQGWRLGLEALGTTHASTYSNPGPVVLRNESATEFLARKLVTVGPTGLHAAPAVCDANGQTRLVGLASEYDSVPLLGSVIRSQAHDRYQSQLPVAKRQAEQRVADRVRRSLDEESESSLARLRDRYVTEVLGRTNQLGLDVQPLELRTTESRLIARLRVANPRQLAAHTPRNRAPRDSLASLQVHESLVNNAVESLGLSGRRWTPDELQEFVRTQLQLPGETIKATDEPLELVFEENDPASVRLDGGQAEIVLSVRDMTFGKSRFQRFKVHAFYQPEANGIEAQLVRVGGVQIEGRMRAASRLKLHGVFSQVLDETKPIPLLRLPPQGEPRLDGLMVTQLVIGDGWLGLALGPNQNGRRVATIGRYVR